MSKIKICGIKRTEDIEIVNKYKPDYIGFIFSKSPRQIDFETAKELKSKLDKGIRVVGVFVNEPIDFIVKLCISNVIDVVQLHGDEDDEYIKQLRTLVKCRIIKAVRVKSTEQILQEEQKKCDFLLLDTYKKDVYGGSGEKFNWDLIPNDLVKEYFLAGGLNANNIQLAIKTLHPFCVDVSSSVETDGIKDEQKVKEIIEKVRSVN
ncbi:MAG: phosphoribosylanthranilate isomerase [Ruminococcus sp.]|nr:phosphoribosylanthranilate isomerase [Ruminococcus sp.]